MTHVPITSSLQGYKKLVLAISILLVLGLGAAGWWHHRQNRLDKLAQSELFQAVYYFETGKYGKALEGDGIYPGFLNLIENYKYTRTSNLAHLYAGCCCMYQERYPEAIIHLNHFKSSDPLFQARAWSLIADGFVEQKRYEEAIPYYFKAANHRPNKYVSPVYLRKAALAYEAQKAYPKALECYQAIVNKYGKSSFKRQAEKEIARLEALL
jgi:tetratricopeptide (TPR) repeat protein